MLKVSLSLSPKQEIENTQKTNYGLNFRLTFDLFPLSPSFSVRLSLSLSLSLSIVLQCLTLSFSVCLSVSLSQFPWLIRHIRVKSSLDCVFGFSSFLLSNWELSTFCHFFMCLFEERERERE
jgi:hypothetical protein